MTDIDYAELREKAERYAEVNAGHPSADGQMPMRVADVLALLDEIERQRRINRSAEAYTQDLEKVVDQAAKSVTGVLRAIDSFSWHQHDGVFVEATREHAAAAYDALTTTVSDIETKVRERDAALMEALADDLARGDYLGLSQQGRGVAVDWLREKARERREGVT